MLGRTAANLFWLSRYVERAENMARLLDVGSRMALMPGADSGYQEQWRSILQAAAVDQAYSSRHEDVTAEAVAQFMLFDKNNPSSVHSCLKTARDNARAVRAAITTDMWESLNATWLEFSEIRPSSASRNKLPDLLDWIKSSSHQFRGALLGTILRDDGFSFSQLGVFTERADNTTRILDMKYYVLLPRSAAVGGDVDSQQWAMILRAASAHRSYRHVYSGRYTAWNIADFLILRPEMPRSLHFCYRYLHSTLSDLERMYGERCECHDLAWETLSTLSTSTMTGIFQDGLHEFLSEFISGNNRLTESISYHYNFP